MHSRPINVLLIDDQYQDSRWVQELLAELDENRFRSSWMSGFEVFPLERLFDTLTLLGNQQERDRFDAILLNTAQSDMHGLHAYLRVRSAAPGHPILILSDEDDPDLAISLIRAGAEDYLPKLQLDAMPLARAIRLAIERNQMTQNLRTHSWRDELTGLLNRTGFEAFAGRDLTSARHLGLSLACLVVEIDGLKEIAESYGRDEANLALLESAEMISRSLMPPASAARIAESRFAVTMVPATHGEVPSVLALLERSLHRLPASKSNRKNLRIRTGLAWWHPGGAPPDTIDVDDLLHSAIEANRLRLAAPHC